MRELCRGVAGRFLEGVRCGFGTEGVGGSAMAFRINHIHLKAPDPGKAAEWWVTAFKFKIVSDDLRHFGDRFIRCVSEDGALGVNISGARTGEAPGPGDGGVHFGLEHFGLDSEDVTADVARLEALGAKLVEGRS